jgi:hypothetical protein
VGRDNELVCVMLFWAVGGANSIVLLGGVGVRSREKGLNGMGVGREHLLIKGGF